MTSPHDDDLEEVLDEDEHERGTEDATAHHPESGVVAELRAKLSTGKVSNLPLYSLSDRIVVGRGKGSDWQIDDSSLSRQHAELKWSGKDLAIEDLGSANGTRVDGKPVRGATPVPPGATIHFGTVAVVYQVHSDLLEAAAGDPDATRLTSLPPDQIPETRADIILPGGHTGPTERPSGEPQVFRPSQNAADPDEVTIAWDSRAALVRAPEQGVGAQLWDRIKEQWKLNRRPFVLAGAAVYLIALVIGWEVYERRQLAALEEELMNRSVQRAAPTGPIVTSLAPANDPSLVAVDPTERENVLLTAINDYDQGRNREALRSFRRLALDDKDEVAKFMVQLLQRKLEAGLQTAPALPAAPTPATAPAPGAPK